MPVIGQTSIGVPPPVVGPQAPLTFACTWPAIQVYGVGQLLITWSGDQGMPNAAASVQWTGAAPGDASPVYYRPLWAGYVTVTALALGAACAGIAPAILGAAQVTHLRA
jgi:hypothetical protein